MGQAHQAVALRVAAGEQGAARRRAQRRSGVRAGEQDALCGQLIEPGAGDIGMAVCAQVTTEVVPMHEQHVVAWLGHLLSLSVLGTPVKVWDPLVVLFVFGLVPPRAWGGGPQSGSRCSARSAARTNDLDADKDRPHTVAR